MLNDFFKTIRGFVEEYLPKQRCYSDNTIKSYKTALNLLIAYLRTERCFTIRQINFAVFDREMILSFLD